MVTLLKKYVAMKQLTITLELEENINPSFIRRMLGSIKGVMNVKMTNKKDITKDIIKGLDEISAIKEGKTKPKSIESLLEEI